MRDRIVCDVAPKARREETGMYATVWYKISELERSSKREGGSDIGKAGDSNLVES